MKFAGEGSNRTVFSYECCLAVCHDNSISYSYSCCLESASSSNGSIFCGKNYKVREAHSTKLGDQALSMPEIPHNKRLEDLWIPVNIISIQATSAEAIPYERNELEEEKGSRLFFNSMSREYVDKTDQGKAMDSMTNVGEACTERLFAPASRIETRER